jgi:hypothetical protein
MPSLPAIEIELEGYRCKLFGIVCDPCSMRYAGYGILGYDACGDVVVDDIASSAQCSPDGRIERPM